MKSGTRKLEQAELLSACEEQGFTVQRTRKGYRVMKRGGQGMAHLHLTPSDHRAYSRATFLAATT